MSDKSFEQELQQQLQSVNKEQQPERDLWPGIEMALSRQAEKPQHRPAYYGLAAAVCLVAVVGWLTVFQAAPPQLQGEQLVQALSSQHMQQKQALLVKFEGQPALTENWQQQLQELDDAAAAIKQVLAEEPNNMALLKMLQQVHQQQIDLIERVHAPKWRQI